MQAHSVSDTHSKPSRWLVPILGMLMALPPLTIDMYLPAFPNIVRDLGATEGLVQYTLSAYFIGMAIGQMFYGSLSDRYGRKLPLFIGLMVFAFASLGCALAPNIQALLAWRLVQALGGCVTMVVIMAMVRDLFDPQASARIMSRLMLVMAAAPMFAPLLGSQILILFGWRAIFAVLAFYALLSLLAVRFFLPESLDPKHAKSVSLRLALRTYTNLLKDRQFFGFVLTGSFANAGMFAYITGSPFVFIALHGLSPQRYSAIFGANVIGLMLGSQINYRLLANNPPNRVLRMALLVMAIIGLSLVAVTERRLTGSVIWLLLSLFAFMVSLGTIMPNASAGAMSAQAHQAGSAAALMGTIQFGVATLAAMAVGIFNDGTANAMGGVMAFCTVAALLSHSLLVRRDTLPDQQVG